MEKERLMEILNIHSMSNILYLLYRINKKKD